MAKNEVINRPEEAAMGLTGKAPLPATTTDSSSQHLGSLVSKIADELVHSKKLELTEEEGKELAKQIVNFDLDPEFEKKLSQKVSELSGGTKSAGMISLEKDKWPEGAVTPRGPHAKCVLREGENPERYFFITDASPYISYAK